MSKAAPPDQHQREMALAPTRSILVQAPAGSGKTTLLTERFLALLAEVDEPGQVVAITFTNAAAAEMRNRVLDELRNPEHSALALRALAHSNELGWKLLDLPAQLRFSTIDGFCRELALQQPLLSGLGGGLNIAEQPDDLYRRAARLTIETIGSSTDPVLSAALEALLAWRDNNWQDVENQLVAMLGKRDKWMHDFLIERDPDWDELRERLERPFANAVRDGLTKVSQFLGQVAGAREEALELARFACAESGGERHRELAELADFPVPPFATHNALEEAHEALNCLAGMLLTQEGGFRKRFDKTLGFPADRKFEKARVAKLVADLDAVPGLESALADVRCLPPARYTEDDWLIVRACFTVLRHAAGQLKVVFAESAKVDFIEVVQVALATLKADDGSPSDAAIGVADGIRHLLVDEFQDTSRRQYELLGRLIAAWPDRIDRTLFAVGDPMQSIYFFRDADTELFTRTKMNGLEVPNCDPLALEFVPLTANFRTTPPLVNQLNDVFTQVFFTDDGSGVTFTPADPFRGDFHNSEQFFKLHTNFKEQTAYNKAITPILDSKDSDQKEPQTAEIIGLIHSFREAVENARKADAKYRIAVLARARKSLAPIAAALREAQIPFRAVELEKLADRPEVLDALALARALLNPQDRVAWLGVLRAPWCGLTLADLHLLTSADEPGLLARPIPPLLAERLLLLSEDGRQGVGRIFQALDSVPALRASQPTASLGTSLQQVWLRLGGAACVDATASANLDLLWSCLDRLPGGAQDLPGPALSAALEKLTALPDPAASTVCGVQLMTIHKSKGLEFEVVIVPDLQAGARSGKQTMLSWLERGLTEPNDPGEITEFLIAPQQSKGEDKGRAKAWVDRVYRERESQEDRRILYVAATRARDQLHLFAQPAYKQDKDGSLTLCEPTNSLLATAWPALEAEVRSNFEDWKTTRQTAPAEVADIAASSDSNLIVMPSSSSPAKPTILRRLPPGYSAPSSPHLLAERMGGSASPIGSEDSEGKLYARHEGGLLSRALGTAVHALLEELARLRLSNEWPAARAALQKFEPRIAARVRALGIDQAQAAIVAAEAMRLALDASNDPAAQWILSPHSGAAAEVRWAGVVAGSVSTVRVDRVFRGGLAPESDGEQAWWIVDYKAAHAGAPDSATALTGLRSLFAPQLATYARFLRNLYGSDAVIRAGLYYPRMLLFDWWEL